MFRSTSDAASLKLASDGAQFFPAVLDQDALELCERLFAVHDIARPGSRVYSGLDRLRGLLSPDGHVGRLAAAEQGPASRPVRVLLFNKRPGLNWALGPHQDRTIAVRRRVDTSGFGPWSIKEGQAHVQPPQAVIERMLTLRIHLDETGLQAAPLLVVPGSHKLGRLTDPAIQAAARATEPIACLAERGDVWMYATAIVHGSDAFRAPTGQRRVLQIDYAAEDLPGGLGWALCF